MTHILVATGPIHQDLTVCYSNMVVFSSDKCNLNSLTLLHFAVMIAWVIMQSMKKKGFNLYNALRFKVITYICVSQITKIIG